MKQFLLALCLLVCSVLALQVEFHGKPLELSAMLGEGMFSRVYRTKEFPLDHVLKINKYTSNDENYMRRQHGWFNSKEVPILDRVGMLLGTDTTKDNKIMIKMKLIRGKVIADWVKKGSVRDYRDLKTFAVALHDAIVKLHKMNVAHNDIHLNNVLFKVSLSSNTIPLVQKVTAHLIDFGLSKELDRMDDCYWTAQKAVGIDWKQFSKFFDRVRSRLGHLIQGNPDDLDYFVEDIMEEYVISNNYYRVSLAAMKSEDPEQDDDQDWVLPQKGPSKAAKRASLGTFKR